MLRLEGASAAQRGVQSGGCAGRGGSGKALEGFRRRCNLAFSSSEDVLAAVRSMGRRGSRLEARGQGTGRDGSAGDRPGGGQLWRALVLSHNDP